MEGDTGGEAMTSPKKNREYFQNPDREVNQQELAELLRKSANLVERGEFGSILYEALQDFRLYYKQKYPKNHKKKKKEIKKEKSERGTRTIPVSNQSNERTEATSSSILEDLKESEGKNNLKESENGEVKSADEDDKKADPDGDTHFTKDQTKSQSERYSERCNDIDQTTPSTGPYDENTSEAVNDDPDANASSPDHDATTKSEPSPSKTEVPIAEETTAEESTPSLPDEDSNVNESVTSDPVVDAAPPTPSGDAPKPTVESAPSIPTQTFASELPFTPTTTKSPFKPSSQQKSGFGKKFKLGATLQKAKKGADKMKKAAKNVTEKISENIHIDKHNNRGSVNPRDDIAFFSETGVTMAQSSGRRAHAGEQSSEFQSRMTPGAAGASAAASEHEQNTSDRDTDNKHSYQSSIDSHGRSGSDRSLGQPGVDNNPNSQAQATQSGSTSRFESNRFLNKQEQKPAGPQRFERFTSPSAPTLPGTNRFESARFAQPPRDHTYKSSEDGDSFDTERVGIVSEGSFEEADPVMECDNKPKFQRPDNANSPLIVSGWIEQYRRSKMRYVWKEVLVSLVEGRKAGEVTTLWIQREMTNPSTGQKELEALHRIPLQIVEDVSFSDQTTDYQFRIRPYNSTEDFVFRCEDSPNDALRWVQILKKYEQLTKKAVDNSENMEDSQTTNAFMQAASCKGMPIRDLRAICNGAGVNTAGMERSELEAAAEEVQRQGTYFNQQGDVTAPSASQAYPNTQPYAPPQQQQNNPHTNQDSTETSRSRSPPPSATESAPPQQEQPQANKRMGIKELRAICHGAGVNTVGMERRELEAAAKEVQSRGTYFDPPIGMHASNQDDGRARQEELRRQQQQKEEARKRQQEAEERHRREVDAARQRQAYAEEQQRRRAAEEEARRRAYEEEQRRRAAEEEARRKAAAEEQLRRQREAQAAQKRYAQQQAAWQQQQHAEEQRRRAAEQQAAAERRRRDEARRQEQQWAAPAPGAHPQQQWQQQQQRHQAYPPQQQQWQQSQQQQRPPPQRPPPQQHHQQQQARHTPPPQQQQRQQSTSDNKYAQMANQSGDDGQAAITKIKHGILIQWGLQPPQLQMLRPIAALVTTIHSVFPPALGVSGHEYFKKWKPITREDVAGVNGLPEEAKLKKMVRKIRFFLHPDKLPHDLDEEQKFTVKMLWDITNDAWEEYQKHKETLDWVN